MADEQKSPEPEAASNPKDVRTIDPKDITEGMIYVKVYSPYQIYYDGEAKSISAENDTGPFDILAKHHNFMTLVNAGEVIVRPGEGEVKKIRITRGVMHVRMNKVTLFLDV